MQASVAAPGDEPAGLSRPEGDGFEAARDRVGAFVSETFSWRGALELHRRSLGWDLLRAPVNVALAPVNLALRLAGLACRGLGARGVAGWLGRRDLFLRTSVAREIEGRIVTRLLGVGAPGEGSVPRALAGSALVRDPDGGAPAPDEAAARAERAALAIRAYSGTRAAVAEITTALVVLGAGAAVFGALTPGALSMAPTVADALAREAAVAGFPLGTVAGGLWYGLFPVGATAGEVVAAGVALMVAAAVVTAFAGVVADPVQAALGLHRRRLLRLIDTLEAELTGAAPRPFAAHEHYLARFADVMDAVSAVLRVR